MSLAFRAADAAESRGFRALFSTEEDCALAAGAPFAGQVRYDITLCCFDGPVNILWWFMLFVQVVLRTL